MLPVVLAKKLLSKTAPTYWKESITTCIHFIYHLCIGKIVSLIFWVILDSKEKIITNITWKYIFICPPRYLPPIILRINMFITTNLQLFQETINYHGITAGVADFHHWFKSGHTTIPIMNCFWTPNMSLNIHGEVLHKYYSSKHPKPFCPSTYFIFLYF